LASSTTPDGNLTPQRLREAAAHGFVALPGGDDTPTPGEPERVGTPDGALGYYLVPDRRDGGVVAVARVLPNGRVASVARLAAPTVDCAAAVTGLSAAQSLALADDVARRHGGTLVGEPCLVHDGPVGREAWLLVVQGPDDERHWVFATGGGTYARKPGDPPRGGLI
jgi:hypothetical protein